MCLLIKSSGSMKIEITLLLNAVWGTYSRNFIRASLGNLVYLFEVT